MKLIDMKIEEAHRALIQFKGNKTHAAKALGIAIRTMRNWVRKYDLLKEFRRGPFIAGFLSCILIMGCAGMSYKYYGLADVMYDHGTLLGPKEKDDLPFSKCAPNGESKNPCVVMFTKEFMAFKLDYEDTKQKLKACEKK